MPTHDRLGPDDRDRLQDQRKPPVQLDEEQAIGIREMNATSYLALQHCHLMPERGVLRRKPALRPKGQGEQRQQKAEQREHGSLTVGDSPTKSTRMEFSVHTGLGNAQLMAPPFHRLPLSQIPEQVRHCGFLMATRTSL
jgi:hypothetical protein